VGGKRSGANRRGRTAALISLTEPVYLGPNITTHDVANRAFVLNHDDFKVSLADIFVDGGVMNTFIVGQGTVEDESGPQCQDHFSAAIS